MQLCIFIRKDEFYETKKKKRITQIIAATYSAGCLCCIGIFSTIQASAATMGDVIAKARAVGMPEAQIQEYINQYGSNEYTSEQYDAAISALDGYKASVDSAIEEVFSRDTSDSNGSDDKSDNSSQTSASSSSSSSSSSSVEAVTEQEFIDMSLEEKVSYVNSLSSDERSEFLENLSNDERNSILKQMDAEDQISVIASMADVGESFGISYSIDSISNGTVIISGRDEDGNLVSVSTFGDTVEETGISYTKPIAIGTGAILLAVSGFGIIFWYSGKKSKNNLK